jgi:HTH-type transcriptional regulator/antitoxin HigA
MNLKPIKTTEDHESALRRVEQLWDAPVGSPEDDELEILATLIDAYENEHYPIDLPNPIEAIQFRLEQRNENAESLVGIIGPRPVVRDVMRGKRPLTLAMIRSLHDKLGIPAEVLIQDRRRKNARPARVAKTLARQNRSSVRKSA